MPAPPVWAARGLSCGLSVVGPHSLSEERTGSSRTRVRDRVVSRSLITGSYCVTLTFRLPSRPHSRTCSGVVGAEMAASTCLRIMLGACVLAWTCTVVGAQPPLRTLGALLAAAAQLRHVLGQAACIGSWPCAAGCYASGAYGACTACPPNTFSIGGVISAGGCSSDSWTLSGPSDAYFSMSFDAAEGMAGFTRTNPSITSDTYVPDRFGRAGAALALPGTQGWLTSFRGETFNSFSMSAWVRFDAHGGRVANLANFGRCSNNQQIGWYNLDSLYDAVWHSLVLTCTSTSCTTFVDGSQLIVGTSLGSFALEYFAVSSHCWRLVLAAWVILLVSLGAASSTTCGFLCAF